MRLDRVEYQKQHWYMTVYLHCDYNLVRRIGGGSTKDWELVDGNLDLDLFDEWAEELLQKHLESIRWSQ
jgi:hypothetical protein